MSGSGAHLTGRHRGPARVYVRGAHVTTDVVCDRAPGLARRGAGTWHHRAAWAEASACVEEQAPLTAAQLATRDGLCQFFFPAASTGTGSRTCSSFCVGDLRFCRLCI